MKKIWLRNSILFKVFVCTKCSSLYRNTIQIINLGNFHLQFWNKMTGVHPEVIILIDTSAFSNKTELKDDLVDHVKEAVSFQISRGTISNKKLIRLGVRLEPYLARVKWTYIFFDSTQCHSASEKNKSLGQFTKTLTYECWDLFEKELKEQVKCSSNSTQDTKLPVNSRMKNVVNILENLKFQHFRPHGSNPDLTNSKNVELSTTSPSIEKFIIVFTAVPKMFSCLVHLAAGITSCRHSMSVAADCSPEYIQICLVDVKLDSISLQDYTGLLGKLPCFWDDVYNDAQQHNHEYSTLHPGRKLSLRIECLKKIMMIHKLMEMRFPWMYDHSLPFGLGLGMKRLRQWEWKIPEEIPRAKRYPGCLSLRKCCSEEVYYLEDT